jgi:anti-anti-sigma factor
VNSDPPSSALAWPLRISEEQRDGTVIVELGGRLAEASAERLTARLGSLIAGGARHLVLDLSQLDYISSAGLLAVDLAAAHLHAVDGHLVLCGPTDAVRMAFELAGFLPRYIVEGSRDRAVARLCSM